MVECAGILCSYNRPGNLKTLANNIRGSFEFMSNPQLPFIFVGIEWCEGIDNSGKMWFSYGRNNCDFKVIDLNSKNNSPLSFKERSE